MLAEVEVSVDVGYWDGTGRGEATKYNPVI